jgi:hypothetical protein
MLVVGEDDVVQMEASEGAEQVCSVVSEVNDGGQERGRDKSESSVIFILCLCPHIGWCT